MLKAIRRTAPRLADWGHGVTICIAAIAEDGTKFVFAADRKVSFGDFSADRAVIKFEPIIERTCVFTAGNDVARARCVLDRTKQKIKQGWIRDADMIADSLFQECNAERDRLIEASVLRRRGFSWEMFRTGGKNLCTDSVYYEMQSEIAEVKLSLDFMVAGFDSEEKPHIRYTNWHTPPENYDDLGFYAIGSGANAAMSYLSHAVEYLGFTRSKKASELLYHVLAAKFMSESAQDVGKDTFAMVAKGKKKDDPPYKPGDPVDSILSLPVFAGIDFVREKWEKEGAPKLPKGISEAIEELLVPPHKMHGLESLQRSAKHYRRAKRTLRRFEKFYEKKQSEMAANKADSTKQLDVQKSESEQ